METRKEKLRAEAKDGAEANSLGILRDERFQEAAGVAEGARIDAECPPLAASIRGSQYAPLRSQMIRAAMSMSANIVEGREQRNEREFARFLGYALASTSELEYHLIVARDVRAITSTDFSSTVAQVIDVRKMLHGLLGKLKRSKQRSPEKTVPSFSAGSE